VEVLSLRASRLPVLGRTEACSMVVDVATSSTRSDRHVSQRAGDVSVDRDWSPNYMSILCSQRPRLCVPSVQFQVMYCYASLQKYDNLQNRTSIENCKPRRRNIIVIALSPILSRLHGRCYCGQSQDRNVETVRVISYCRSHRKRKKDRESRIVHVGRTG